MIKTLRERTTRNLTLATSVSPILVIISRLLYARLLTFKSLRCKLQNELSPNEYGRKLLQKSNKCLHYECNQLSNTSTFRDALYNPFGISHFENHYFYFEKLKPTYCSYICLFCFRFKQVPPMIHCGLPIFNYQICPTQSKNASKKRNDCPCHQQNGRIRWRQDVWDM